MTNIKQILANFNSIKRNSHELSAIYIKQLGAATIIKGLSVVISIIYVPLVLGYLDQEKYGIWVTLSTIVNWVRLLDVGMGNGMRNKISEAFALKKNEQSRVYVSTTYVIVGSIFLMALIVFYLINPLLNWQVILNTHILSRAELLRLTNVAVTFIILGFIFQPVILIYAAHGNTAAGGIVQLVISILTLILIWSASLFANKGNIILLAWIVTGIPVAVYIIFSIITFCGKYRSLRPSLSFVKIDESGNLLRLSGQFFIVQITAAIIYSSIPFVVIQLFNPNEVTVFNIANSIFNLPIMIMGLITAPGHPLITQAYAKNDLPWMRSLLKKQMVISGLLSFGTVVMIIISPIIYKLWIGNRVLIPFSLSLSIGIYSIIQVLNAPFSTFINATGKIKILVILGPIGIILFVALSILLSHMLRDVIAISIALSVISMISLVLIPLQLQRILKKSSYSLIGK